MTEIMLKEIVVNITLVIGLLGLMYPALYGILYHYREMKKEKHKKHKHVH